MESQRFYEYRVTSADTSYSSSSSRPPSSFIPTRRSASLKFETRNSPNSPFSTHFDSEVFTTLSDSQETYRTTDNLSVASPSSLEGSSSFQQRNPTFLQNAIRGHCIKDALLHIETTLMAADDEVTMPESSPMSRSWSQETPVSHYTQPEPSYVARHVSQGGAVHAEYQQNIMDQVSFQSIPPGNLKLLLIACARALAENKLDEFEKLIERARISVSIGGEPIQRLGAYMVEGLVARKELSGTRIYRSLRCNEPAGKDLLSYMHILYEVCPYLKFGYMAANGAIAEACRNEDQIHIIDFQIAQGTQWMTLLQALAARPSGAPRVRITGIDDPISRHARGDGLEAVGRRLAAISEKFKIPIEFHPLPVYAPYITKEMLDVRPGEALAVNFPLQLHHTPDESVDVNNPRDERLRMVKSLSPKVVTLIEQESNTNTAPFFARFLETLEYYLAMFESIDVTMPRESKERINVEQHCLARDIVNIIACEGRERVERHELLGKWKSRLTMAGFRQYPLSSYVNSVIRGLLRCYSEHYTLVEKDGAMLLGWKDRNLVSASAWH